MFLSSINIRLVPRRVLKTSGYALGLQHSPRDLANVNEWKIIFDPYIKRRHHEMAQSERNSHSKNRGGKNKLTIRYLYY